MHIRLLIGIVVLAGAGAVFAQAYKWTDEDGIVHYSDRPHPGAERIQLPTAPLPGTRPIPRPTAAAARVTRTSTSAAEQAPTVQAPFSYESLTITSPAAEETLWNIEGVLNVSLDLRPALQAGHKVWVHFDGEPQPMSGTTFQLQPVYRGIHNLQVEVLDATGKLMIRSQTNRFYVQQTNIN